MDRVQSLTDIQREMQRERTVSNVPSFGCLAARLMCSMHNDITHEILSMRTNIVIDDQLMQRALATSGYRTKREAVEAGLRLLVRLKEQERIREARGKLPWEGDLEAMRYDQVSN